MLILNKWINFAAINWWKITPFSHYILEFDFQVRVLGNSYSKAMHVQTRKTSPAENVGASQ